MVLFLPALAATLVSAYFANKQKGANRSLLEPGRDAAQAEAERIRQGTRLRSELEDMVKQMAQGGPPPVFRLGTRPGEGSDIEEFMSGIQSNAEFNKLMQVLNAGEGPTGASTSALQLGFQGEQDRRGANQDLINALLMAGLGLGGGGTSFGND